MRFLPSGTRALLVELDSLKEVMALYAGLEADPPDGVIDLVPAARTVLVVLARDAARCDVARALAAASPRTAGGPAGPVVQVPVRYDGDDLWDAAASLGLGVDDMVRRHTDVEWTVSFCGFAPGFGYLTSSLGWDVPRRSSPRTTVPQGAVGLAGEFSAVYPRRSPGGWQLIGHTTLEMFRLDREPPALLSPGTRVRFMDIGS